MITSGAFISMSFLGMTRTFLGTALPAIRSSLDLTILQAGTLTALLQFGFSIAVFVGGPFADIFKKSSMLMLGCLLMGINLLLFGLSNWFWINIAAMGLIGIGGGLIESSSNPLLIQLFPGRESTVMNLHHFFFAVGSLSGPVIMGLALTKSIPWQWAYMGFGFFVLAVCFFLLFQRISSPQRGSRFDVELIGKLMREKSFLTLFFVSFFNSGVQNGIGYWVVTFLKESRGFPIGLASSTLFLFFACLALGRLFSSYLTTKFQEVSYLLFLFSLLFVGLLIAALAPGQWAIPFFGVCGLAHSGVFPCVLATTGKLYSKNTGTALGLMATGAGLGGMVVPWLMSLVSQMTTLQTGFLFAEVFVMSGFILMGVYSGRLRQVRTVAG
jgi:MFS transporter, FHS family, glucose/mannose:H+ symporter